LTAQAVSGSVDATSRGFIDQEYDSLKAEAIAIGTNTTFNGTALLTGNYNATNNVATFQVGIAVGDTIVADLTTVVVTAADRERQREYLEQRDFYQAYDRELAEQRAMNGQASPVYIIEEAVIGGALGRLLFGASSSTVGGYVATTEGAVWSAGGRDSAQRMVSVGFVEAPALRSASTGGSVANSIESGAVRLVNPAELRWTQTTAGGNGRASIWRERLDPSSGYNAYPLEPIDVVRTPDGLVTVDHTRAAIALEYGIKEIPVRVYMPDDLLPVSMTSGLRPRFGPSTTWGEAAAYRASRQVPPLPPTGTPTPPRLPRR